MADLPTRSHSTIVATIVAGIQGRAKQLIDFGKGSPLLAITQGFGEVFLWFQALALGVLKATRLSTSQKSDVDTFAADFMPPVAGTTSPRLGAQAAAGLLTFSRLTAGASSCFVPVGATAQTADGSQNYVVTADPTFGTYSVHPPGYTMVPAVGTLVVPAAAVTPGLAGNAQPGAISVITSAMTGIDAVVNVAAFVGGEDQESDDELKKRFSDYILGLSRGDQYGLAAAIEGTNVIVQWTLTESYNFDGSWRPGFFFVVADDGSGAPSADFLQKITDAVYSVRPLGIQAAVHAPTIRSAAVSMSITTAPGYDHNVLVGLVANAVTTGIDTLGLGVDLDYNRLSSWAYSVPGVTKVSAVLLNSLTGDAAFISASRATLDSMSSMAIYTVKCTSCVVS